MTQADRIRAEVIRTIILPARASGLALVTIRAGDVHRAMGFNNSFPAVCSALRGTKLEREACVTFLGQEGPLNGANVFFRFDLSGEPVFRNTQSERPERLTQGTDAKSSRKSHVPLPSLEGALVLVSCSKAKLTHAAPARELYCSPAFQMKRALIERVGAQWAILSAKHGLVEPGATVAPYDLTLTSMGVSARRAWARDVTPHLLTRMQGFDSVVMLAGQSYCEHLVGPLTERGISFSEPVRGLRQGEQLAWLVKHR